METGVGTAIVSALDASEAFAKSEDEENWTETLEGDRVRVRFLSTGDGVATYPVAGAVASDYPYGLAWDSGEYFCVDFHDDETGRRRKLYRLEEQGIMAQIFDVEVS